MIGRLKLPASIIGQTSVVLAVLFVMLDGWHRNFHVPLSFTGDALEYLMQVKGTIDHGWWWTNPHVAAPSTFAQVAYPSDTNVDQAVVWIVSWFTQNAALCLNITWLLLVALAAPIATACLTRLGVSRPVAWVAGVLFALSPYALYRHIDHFALVIYLVPLPCTAALLVATGRLGAIRSSASLGLLAGCVLLGFNYTYYAFFGCFVLLAAAALAWVDGHRRAAQYGLLFTGAIVLATAVNLVPSLVAWGRFGEPLAVPDKTAAEAETYGLKIRQLVSPTFEHPLAPFRQWTEAETRARFPLETENTRSRLGLLETVGFLVLLIAALAPRIATYLGDAPIIAAAGRLTMASILLGTVGGFGSLFALLVSPEIRSYNRLCAFIAFFAWVAVAGWLDRLWQRRPSSVLAVTSLIAIAAVGLVDQRPAVGGLNETHAAIQQEFDGLRWFVESLEPKLEPGAMVFELPALLYLNDAGHLRMQPYDLIKPYLVSHTLHWSYPALADDVVRWQQAVGRLRAPELHRALIWAGFSAVAIDRYGYEDNGAEVTSALLATGARVVAESGRYVGLALREESLRDPAPAFLPMWTGAFLPATRGLRHSDPYPDCTGPGAGAIDLIGDVRAPFDRAAIPLARSGRVAIRGWAVDENGHDLAGDVDVMVDGEPWATLYGLDRADIAARLKHPRYRPSGFLAKVPAARLPPGQHVLSIRALSADRRCAASAGTITVLVR